MRSKRILFATFGSLGDLYPYLALAAGMQKRGHRAAIASNVQHQHRVETSGVRFHGVAPYLDFSDQTFLKRTLAEREGGRYLLHEVILPQIRASYEGLLAAASEADLLVTQVLAFAGPLVAEKTGMPWVSTVLAPLSLFSYQDSPVLASRLGGIRQAAPWLNAFINRVARYSTRSWSAPVHRLRDELGLQPKGNPLFEAQHSRLAVLALFSPLLAKAQADWPRHTVTTGFPFWEEQPEEGAAKAALDRFLAAGDPPIVFTLGSSAVMDPGRFYIESIEAARRRRVRAVLLGGEPEAGTPLGDDIFCIPYAPHSYLFSKARVCVHPGGIGTSARALRAGCPMLVVPFAHDQPDNAARLVRLGVARTLRRTHYSASHAADNLGELLGDPRYRSRADDVALAVQSEDGVGAACAVLERCLSV